MAIASIATWAGKQAIKDGIVSRLAKLVPLRSWFKWLARSGQMPLDFIERLELPAYVRSLPRNLPSLQEVQAVLD